MKVCGTMYKKPCSLIVSMEDSIFPKFGQLQDILVHKEEVLFHLKMYETLSYSEHFNAFVVKTTSVLTTVNQCDLLSCVPHHVRTIDGLTSHMQKAIVVKHHMSSV